MLALGAAVFRFARLVFSCLLFIMCLFCLLLFPHTVGAAVFCTQEPRLAGLDSRLSLSMRDGIPEHEWRGKEPPLGFNHPQLEILCKLNITNKIVVKKTRHPLVRNIM